MRPRPAAIAVRPSAFARRRAASGVRFAGAADRDHRASGSGLCLRLSRQADPGGFSRRRDGACPIWRSPRRRGLSPCPAIDSRGSNGRGARRSHRRRWPLRRQGRNGRGGACAGRRADRRPHPRHACAASTRRACESAARRNGCIQWPPKPSHFTAPAPSVARCRKASKAASSSMTASSPIAIWTALRGPRPCALQRSPSARTQSPHCARQ